MDGRLAASRCDGLQMHRRSTRHIAALGPLVVGDVTRVFLEFAAVTRRDDLWSLGSRSTKTTTASPPRGALRQLLAEHLGMTLHGCRRIVPEGFQYAFRPEPSASSRAYRRARSRDAASSAPLDEAVAIPSMSRASPPMRSRPIFSDRGRRGFERAQRRRLLQLAGSRLTRRSQRCCCCCAGANRHARVRGVEAFAARFMFDAGPRAHRTRGCSRRACDRRRKLCPQLTPGRELEGPRLLPASVLRFVVGR